jgi:hypothetical protein
MSANKQRTISRFWSTVKQSLTGLFAQSGQIDIVADTATNHLFAIKSDGTQVDLEANTAIGTATIILDFNGSAGAGAIGKVVVATLGDNLLIDEIKIFQTFDSTDPAEYPRLVPSNNVATITPQLLKTGTYYDLAAAGATTLDINTDGKTTFDCAVRLGNTVFITAAGNQLVLDISGAAITAGTILVNYSYIIGSQIQEKI